MAKLKGKYTFKEVLDVEGLIAAGELTEYFNFISGYEGNPVQHYVLEHSGMYIEYDYFGTGIYFGYLTPPNNTMNLVYYTRWQNERLRYVDFGDGVTMSDRLSSWVLANADPVVDPQYSIKTSTLTAIADSIRAKTGGSDPILTENMASEIEGIDTAEPWDESFTVKNGAVIENQMQLLIDAKGSMERLFYDAKTLTGETAVKLLSGIDTSNITSMQYAFYRCSVLTEVPHFDTKNVTAFNEAFSGCVKLTRVQNLDTSAGTSFGGMFRGCASLTDIPTTFDLSKTSVSSCGNMFYGCTNLEKLDLKNLNLIQGGFVSGSKLKTIILRNTNNTITALSDRYTLAGVGAFGTKNGGGKIYVYQRFLEEYQNATNWSSMYADKYCTFLPIEGSEYE